MKELMQEILKRQNIETSPEPFIKYCELLLSRNEVMNLTAITEPREVLIRHFADSIALLHMHDFCGKRVIDIGCGAGFPGLPIRLAEPSVSLCLLDSLGKRIKFLEDTTAAIGVSDVECLHARAEEQAQLPDYREGFDIAVSRAVASLNMLCELSLPFVKVGGVFIAMKSQNCEEELESAKKAISVLGGELYDRVDYPLHDTGITHTALIIKKVSPTQAKYPRRFAKIKSAPL